MFSWKILLTTLIFLYYFNCGLPRNTMSSVENTKNVNLPNQSTSQEITKDLVITLERTVCFGTCPAYKLTVKSDGTVSFEGLEFTKVKRKVEGKITQDNLKTLVSEFEKADFFNLKDSYRLEEDGCKEVWTDNPSEIISIQSGEKSKRVLRYFGCQKIEGNDLEKIANLGKKIDEITNSKQWIGKK
jgi:hypothetical protein